MIRANQGSVREGEKERGREGGRVDKRDGGRGGEEMLIGREDVGGKGEGRKEESIAFMVIVMSGMVVVIRNGVQYYYY